MKTKSTVNCKYLTKIEQLEQLSKAEHAELKKVTDKFAFRSNDYYLSLINWDDPDDPIRTVIIPHIQEIDEWGRLDPSDEKSYRIICCLFVNQFYTYLFYFSYFLCYEPYCSGLVSYFIFRLYFAITPNT